jgi:hypothetical protein
MRRKKFIFLAQGKLYGIIFFLNSFYVETIHKLFVD